MFDVLIARPVGRVRDSLARRLARAGVSPNTLTLAGSVLQCSVGWLFYRGHWTAGGTLLLFSSSFDVLDGAVARLSGRASRFGAFLDSTMDRLSDMALFAGLVAYYAHGRQPFLSILAFYCLAQAILISYTKARAENLIPDCTVGLAQRPERIVLLIAASLLHCLPTGLIFIASYSTLTTLQRILHTYRVSKGQKPGPGSLGPAAFLDFGRKSVPYDVLAVVTLGTMLLQGLRG